MRLRSTLTKDAAPCRLLYLRAVGFFGQCWCHRTGGGRGSEQLGFPLSIAGGDPVIFIRLREQVCPGLVVLKSLHRHARFLRLQTPEIGMAQRLVQWGVSKSSYGSDIPRALSVVSRRQERERSLSHRCPKVSLWFFSAGDAISVRLYLVNSEKIIASCAGRTHSGAVISALRPTPSAPVADH